MCKVSLRRRILRLAWENPGPLREALMPLITPERGLTWERQSIEIPISSGVAQTIPALVSGVWAVHRSIHGSDWSLTHVPTGLAANTRIASRVLAQAIVEAMVRTEPALRTAATQADVMRFSNTIVDIMRSPGDYTPRKPE